MLAGRRAAVMLSCAWFVPAEFCLTTIVGDASLCHASLVAESSQSPHLRLKLLLSNLYRAPMLPLAPVLQARVGAKYDIELKAEDLMQLVEDYKQASH